MLQHKVKSAPDSKGYFGEFGGRFVPETVMPALDELIHEFQDAWNDASFRNNFSLLQAQYVGRPTPLSHARRLSEQLGGAQIYLKREDLAHTGAHKINNALGQALLAKRMGKKRIIAETGAGQHGVAAATACALLGLDCIVYMGEIDMARGSRTLKDAINEAIRDWVTNVRTTFYLLGSALGPHPYPLMVREFQSIIGIEAREQILHQTGRLPNVCIACIGGGSNAIGIFHGGRGIASGAHAARFADPNRGRRGTLHGTYSYVLQDEDGQIMNTHSISAGLDYAAIGPEHAFLRQNERAHYTLATDSEVLAAFRLLCETEGIIPALESAHAIAEVCKRAPELPREAILLVNLSGRGDKDLDTIINLMEPN